jgi:hypothetical protein
MKALRFMVGTEAASELGLMLIYIRALFGTSLPAIVRPVDKVVVADRSHKHEA